MIRKKLTDKQKRQIASNKDKTKSNNTVSDTGLVICNYGQYLDIETSLNKIIRCNIRQNLPPLAVGDKVIYHLNPYFDQNHDTNQENISGIITKLIARDSLLSRTNQFKKSTKPIAANVDQLFVIFAPEPEPQSYLIDQFLIIAESCNIQPVLICNKYDLYQEARINKSQIANLDNLLDIYSNIGYEILILSGLYGKNFHDLTDHLINKTSIFVGQSGVGKSTITKQLIPETELHKQEILTGALSEKSQLGKHTTTTAKLYHLANSANLIDAPGIREMGVTHLSKTEIEQAYIEFRPFLNRCKFRDCEHEREPDCALKSALEQGLIHPTRWDNFKKFIRDVN